MAEKNSLNQVISTMEGWFSKLPPLPNNWKTAIVGITPWLALIFGILGVVIMLMGFGLLTFLSPLVFLAGGARAAGSGLIGAVLGLLSSALLLAAYPGTKARKLSGWNLLFWSEAVSVVSAVVSMALGGVVVAAIGFYILFQIKSHYK